MHTQMCLLVSDASHPLVTVQNAHLKGRNAAVFDVANDSPAVYLLHWGALTAADAHTTKLEQQCTANVSNSAVCFQLIPF